MWTRTRNRWRLLFVIGAAGCGSSAMTDNSGSGLAPTGNVTLSGDHTYSSVSIPAGVTVTVSSDATLTVDSTFTLNGTLVAPCHTLVISAGGSATVTGALRNDCADSTVAGTELDLIAKGGYDFEGATITSSGDIFVLDGTTKPALSSAPSKDLGAIQLSAAGRVASTVSAGGRVASTAAALASFRCQMVNTTISTTPATAQRGADGNPDGTDGSAGRSKTVGCGQSITGQTGGNLLLNGLTLNGGNGGAGGNGTSTIGATSHGGAGGPAGGLQIVSDADIVIQGATINGGSGGNGGKGTSTAASAGGNASAFGGAGGPLKPKNYSSPLTISAGGALTISGGLTINLGNAGAGGSATATGKDGAAGNPGQKGGDAAATGGAGGASTPNTLSATGAISGLSGVVVTGGRGGDGGAALHSAGNGGGSNAAGGAGGPGGGASGSGGAGGNGGTRTGGNGGPAGYAGGNGGAGGDNCGPPPGQGGPGGIGGSQSGGGGLGGTGGSAGATGLTTIVNSFNGGSGGSGVGPGKGGNGGANGTAAGPATITNSFAKGPDGNGCTAVPSSTVQIVNGDTSNPPWDSVQVSVNGSTFTNAAKSGTTYTIDLTGVASTGLVRIVVSYTVGTTKHIVEFDAPAAYLLALANNPNCAVVGQSIARGSRAQAATVNCPLPIANKYWGNLNGSVTLTETGLTSQATVRVGDNVATLNATANRATLNALIGLPTAVSQAIGSANGTATLVSAAVITPTNNQDISATLMPTAPPQNVGITIPAGSIGGPVFVGHSLDVLDYRVVPRLTLLDSWRLNDVGFFSKQNATPTSFGMASIPPSNMPSGALQSYSTTMFMNLDSWLGEVISAKSFVSHSVTFASTYIAPTITTQTGPSGMTFMISGQLAPGYISSEFHSSIALPTATYVIDEYNYQGTSGPFTITLPPIPAGGTGPYLYEAGTNDPFSLPTDGGVYWRAGYKGYLGTPPTQTIAVSGPTTPVSLTHGGGCANVTISVTTTALTQPTFVGFTQTAGAAGTISTTPQNVVIQPGTGSTPIFHSAPITICSSLSSTAGGTANLQVNAASIGSAMLIEGSVILQIVIN